MNVQALTSRALGYMFIGMQLSNDELRAIFQQLDNPCWQCDGRGRHSSAVGPLPPNWIGGSESIKPRSIADAMIDACGPCGGGGHITTEAGEDLLAFLERHKARA